MSQELSPFTSADADRGYDLLEPIPRATQPHAIARSTRLGSHRLFFNRELSWLDFNWRVLHQARDTRVPQIGRAHV